MRATGSAVLMAVLLLGCGSSIRMVHQSNVYFERCHSADFDASVPIDQKRQCWAQWLEHYTTGQSPDRVRYARTRLDALDRGETVAPLPGLQGVEGTQRAEFLSAGSQPQPQVAEAEAQPEGETDAAEGETDAAEGETDAAEGGGKMPTAPPEPIYPSPPSAAETACTPVCNPRWDACVRGCERQPDGCQEACETEYRTCMRGCF